jgi:hypothetical protein
MIARRVRAGSVYVFDPVPLDQSDPRLAHVEPGLYVRVVHLPGCPPANTLGHAHIEAAVSGESLGLVVTNSLRPLTARQRRRLREQGTVGPRKRASRQNHQPPAGGQS